MGTDLRGFCVSAAVRAALSVPDMAKMQVGITVRKPLKPFVKGVAFQYSKPVVLWFGAPPADTTASVRAAWLIRRGSDLLTR